MLVIAQGKHEESTEFAPFEDTNILCQIVKLSLMPKIPGCIKVSLKLLTGANKGKVVGDLVSYDPTNSMAWKYIRLRQAAKCPYHKTEPASVDIEALLLNKAVKCDFGIYVKPVTNKRFQNVDYLLESEEDEVPIAEDGEEVPEVPGDYDYATAPEYEEVVQDMDFPAPTDGDYVPDGDLEMQLDENPFKN